jgi:hypothetical protein
MSLLHFLGVTSINTSFSTDFAFLSGEKKVDYDFAIQAFKKYVLGDPNINNDTITPEVVITDNETALKTSLTIYLLIVP